MTVLLTRREMQSLDRVAIDEIGIPSLVLMEVAGRAVADRAEASARRLDGSSAAGSASGSRSTGTTPSTSSAAVLAVAGLGNNGADAVVAARHLRDRGLAVTLLLIGDPSRASADLNTELAIADRLGLTPQVIAGDAELPKLESLLATHAVVIDGLFGTGLSRPVDGLNARAIEAINAAKRSVIAVDIPSGVDADSGQILGTAIRAEATVTFQHPKIGHAIYPGRELTGELAVADIGIPRALLHRVAPSAEVIERDTAARALPPRRADSHKGTYGHLMVVAGLPDRPGAALLATRAAFRIGAGLVTLASDEETVRRVAPAVLEIMGLSVGRDRPDADRVLEALESRDALAIGPSLTGDEATKKLAIDVLSRAKVPAVVDAGALAAIGRDIAWMKQRSAPTILTPHPGEAAQLAGVDTKAVQADRVNVARRIAAESGAHVVLKGASTIVADPDGKIGVVLAGNPGMAKGGMGDVLTGIIGSLLAQRVDAALASRAGPYLHAEAGDRAARRGQLRLTASDLIDELGRSGEGA